MSWFKENTRLDKKEKECIRESSQHVSGVLLL